MEQGSKEWLKWRLKGIGSSDAPYIMGLSDNYSNYAKRLLSLGNCELGSEKSVASTQGHATEEKMRSAIYMQTGIQFEPMTFVHPEYDFMRCSLDGYAKKGASVTGWECKYVGEKIYDKIKSGHIPEKFLWQIYHQMACAGLTRVYLHAVKHCKELKGPSNENVVVWVKRKPKKIAELIEKEKEFWKKVCDYREMKGIKVG